MKKKKKKKEEEERIVRIRIVRREYLDDEFEAVVAERFESSADQIT